MAWLVREEATPEHGKPPHERTLDELLDMGGIVLDKPDGPSSHQVAAWVRDMLGVSKAGHAGTLDPNVTGVLTVMTGRATAAVEALKGLEKEYVGLLQLRKGQNAGRIAKTFARFQGEVYQLPPKVSAVKRQLRTRTVHELEILEMAPETTPDHVLFRVRCDAGFYVRKLCLDIGLLLKCGGHMEDLRRTAAGPFTEDDAIDLHELKDGLDAWREDGDEAWGREVLQPFEALLKHVPRIELKDSAVDAVCHGAPLRPPGVTRIDDTILAGDMVLLTTLQGEGVALARAGADAKDLLTMERGVAAALERVLMRPGNYPKGWS